jgi:hypothetical protein
MAPLCGRQLSPADRKVWRQAIALLIGLKRRNGFGEMDLAAAVGTAMHRGAAKRYCDDCGVKVAGGATINSGGARLAIPILAWPSIYIESPARYDVDAI